jgi:hypothetical protein
MWPSLRSLQFPATPHKASLSEKARPTVAPCHSLIKSQIPRLQFVRLDKPLVVSTDQVGHSLVQRVADTAGRFERAGCGAQSWLAASCLADAMRGTRRQGDQAEGCQGRCGVWPVVEAFPSTLTAIANPPTPASRDIATGPPTLVVYCTVH